MALVLLIGTLNRVMIVELNVPASLVGVMISLPLIFAPFRAVIGYRSDMHKSALGWKRVPFMYRGTMIQFGGLALMPFALLVLAKQGHADQAPVWLGYSGAAIAFLLVGAGLHTIQTVGLALATDYATVETQPKVVGLMYVMLMVGMIASSFLFGALSCGFHPARLVQVIQGAAVATIVLNLIALWKQESRRSVKAAPQTREPSFAESWESFTQGGQVVRRLDGGRLRDHGLQHGRCAVGALWRTGVAACRRRHDKIDVRVGDRGASRFCVGLARAEPRISIHLGWRASARCLAFPPFSG